MDYNSIADNTFAIVGSQICEIPQNSERIRTTAVQGHRSWCQSKVHMQLPISH